MDKPNPASPLTVFILSTCLSAVAGFAALLRAGKPLTWLTSTSAVLNSGLCGLAISTIWYKQYEQDGYFLVGVSILAGLCETATVDFIIENVKKKGVWLFDRDN